MLKVSQDGSIELTRGDTARLVVTITNELTDAPYEMQPEDELVFSVKKSTKDAEPLIRKSVRGAKAFHIKPEDTQALEFGKYKYDVQLTTVDGDVYTVLGTATIQILDEVTC